MRTIFQIDEGAVGVPFWAEATAGHLTIDLAVDASDRSLDYTVACQGYAPGSDRGTDDPHLLIVVAHPQVPFTAVQYDRFSPSVEPVWDWRSDSL